MFDWSKQCGYAKHSMLWASKKSLFAAFLYFTSFLSWIYLGFGHLVRQKTQFEVDTLCSLTCNEHFMLHLPITELVGPNWTPRDPK